MQWFELGH